LFYFPAKSDLPNVIHRGFPSDLIRGFSVATVYERSNANRAWLLSKVAFSPMNAAGFFLRMLYGHGLILTQRRRRRVAVLLRNLASLLDTSAPVQACLSSRSEALPGLIR
jgi:hypothetical protein